MKNLREALSDYLSLRRGLGFKLGSDETGLSAFVSFLERQGAEYISTHLAAEWCLLGSAQPITKVRKLCYVRGFAKYLKTSDPRTEIPSQDLIRCRPNRPRPYLYTDEEVQKLMEAALGLNSFNRLRHLTYHYLLGLLSVTGMRISEAINLKIDDVDLDGQLLTVRGTKFGKSRLIPLHATDPERRLPALATYLGHVHVADTYWYLTACPELMEEAVKLLEQRGG